MNRKIQMMLYVVCLWSFSVMAQPYATNKKVVDSLKSELLKTKSDTHKAEILIALSENFDLRDRDESMKYATQALDLSKKIGFKLGEGKAYLNYAIALKGSSYAGARGDTREVYFNLRQAVAIFKSENLESELADTYRHIAYAYLTVDNNLPQAYKYTLMALKIHEKLNEKIKTAYVYEDLARFYVVDNKKQEQFDNLNKALNIYLELNDQISAANIKGYIGEWYFDQKKYDQAMRNYNAAFQIFINLGANAPDYGIPWLKGKIASVHLIRAKSDIETGNKNMAQTKLADALELLTSRLNLEMTGGMSHRETYPQLGQCYYLMSETVTGNQKINYLKQSQNYYELSQKLPPYKPDLEVLVQTYEGLANVYSALRNYPLAYKNLQLYNTYRDSVELGKSEKQLLKMKMQYDYDKANEKTKTDQEKKDSETKRIKSRQLFVILALVIIVLAVIVIVVIQQRNNKQKQITNIRLQDEKEKVENALSELKSTQSQLIQSEKMASLGELTAGIAHEIQNPLNFVNNFSDVSIELLNEMEAEIDKGELDEAKAISSDIKQNLEKINHHGKRADAIVKGMLQHSRSSTGQKEPTDINALCDEYLRLSYHGLRAKDKSFNATLHTDFEQNLEKINVVPQEIGRVILNLLTNAFYAVNEKKQSGLENYEPTVSIGTKKNGDQIEIKVSDNGNGMPAHTAEKIFQPFFTTKPTGKGTGLGLSLSYDIVTKGHGGTLRVESKENEFTHFIITLNTAI